MPDQSAAPGSRPLVDAKIVQAGVDGASRPDADGRSAAVPIPATPGARPPIGDGQGLTLEEAKSLAMRLNPVLGQSLAAVGTAAGNQEIAYSGFLPSHQGDYSYQAFSSDVGFAGTRGRFPVLPVRGFGPGAQDFHVAELPLRWAVFQFGLQVAKHDQSVLRADIARLQADRARQSIYQYQKAVARPEFAVGAPVAGPATAPEELAAPPPAATTPSPFARPEAPGPSGGTRPSPVDIPRLPPPLGGPDLVPRPTPPFLILPTTPGQPSGSAPTPGTPGLARPPYIGQTRGLP